MYNIAVGSISEHGLFLEWIVFHPPKHLFCIATLLWRGSSQEADFHVVGRVGFDSIYHHYSGYLQFLFNLRSLVFWQVGLGVVLLIACL